MITVKLLGGLGNQMFQRAFGLALESRGYDVQYDRSALVEGTHREYSLHAFVPEIKFGESTPGKAIYDPGVCDVTKLYPPDGATMIGYWQDERYFQDIESKVREAFQFKTVPTDCNEKLCLTDSVFMHVRRQDYTQLTHFHGMPDIAYYREALRKIRCCHPDAKPFVFSDDLDWCRENFPKDFEFVKGRNKYEDMQYMQSCHHAIIANSSFSWWAAYLGDYPRAGRVVVAPKQWFTEPTMIDRNPSRARWITI